MSNLLRAELTRFASRKIVWIGYGVVLLALAGMVALVATETNPPSAAERAQAQQYFEQNHRDWEAHHEEYEQQCRADPTVTNPDQSCVYTEPQLSDFLSQATFADAGPQVVLIGVAFAGLAAAIVASSLVGADFSTGSMANWLSFIPVRWRVYASKIVVALAGTVVLSAVILAAAIAAMGLIVTAQQGAAAVTGWKTVWAWYGRGMAVVAAGALLGATVGFLTRRTIAAVGIILGYLIVKLLVSGIFQQSSWYGATQPWWPENNALALLQGDYSYSVAERAVTQDGVQYNFVERTLTWEHGLVYLLVGSAVLFVGGLLTFTRRDVT